MTAQFSISVIFPTYNEVKRITQTIREAKAYFEQCQHPYEIVVSVDGDDGTRELVAGMARQDTTLKVIGSVERRGKGYGIRQGVALATGEIIGFADADNKTPIDEFAKCKPWLRDGYAVVIGSCRLGESYIERSQPLYPQLGSKGFSLFLQAVVGLPGIVDTQCKFKFFQRCVAFVGGAHGSLSAAGCPT
jgi:dolichyl-phosphate beta-glucosyltransferase